MTELQELKVGELIPSKYNPRKNFDAAELKDLADSIRTQGVIVPLLVRPLESSGYEIIAGERRFRAAKLAGLAKLPCTIRVLTDQDAREAQIIENLQRTDVTPLEEAEGFQNLFKIAGDARVAVNGTAPKVTVKELAGRVGKSERYVYARLQLLQLAPAVQKALVAGKIEPSHAQELVPLKPEQQAEMLERIEEQREFGGLSVTEIREEIKSRYSERPKAPKPSAKEIAERQRQIKARATEDARWKKQQQQSAEQKALRAKVNALALPALWARMKVAPAKTLDRFVDLIVADQFNSAGMADALDIATGKPLPDRGYRHVPGLEKKLAALPRLTRIALVVLGMVVDDCGEWREPGKLAAELFQWAGVDRRALVRKVSAETKQAAASKAVPAKVQTSAKPKRPARTKKRKSQKSK